MLEFLQASKKFTNQRLPSYFKEFEGKVSISLILGKGRCLLAQESFDPGDLIIGHRALEIIFPECQTTSSSLLAKVKRFRLLKESLAELASNDADFRRKLYKLSAGPKLSFKDGATELTSIRDDPLEKVSLKRIEGIIVVNGFQGQGGPFGLWYLPSFINHDCAKVNANWSVINDFIFIRAVRRICPGNEILISYTDPDQPYFVRRELFLKHNFLCGCKLCKLESQEGQEIRERRDQILIRFQDLVNSSPSDTADPLRITCLLDELRSLRSPEVENPFVLQPLMQLGLSLFERSCFNEALSGFKEGIKVCETFPQFSSVGTTLACAVLRCYFKLRIEIEDKNIPTEDKYSETIQEWIRNLQGWMSIQYGCKKDQDDEDWREILSLTNPSFSAQLEKYLNQ